WEADSRTADHRGSVGDPSQARFIPVPDCEGSTSMSTRTQDALMDVFADLGSLYPNLRFGQLIEMLALLSAEETPRHATDVVDDQLLNTASHHARTRREQLKS